MNRYDVGDTVKVTATFTRTDTGALTDPSTVTCTFLRPDRTTQTASTSSSSTGVWDAEVDVDVSGVWRYRFLGTSADVGVEEGAFVVRRQRVV
jgi:hypothetical protein